MRLTKVFKIFIATILIIAATGAVFAAEIKSGETIAFLRNNDVWLMNDDGSNQRAWVSGIGNIRGRLSWSPDNKNLVFTRQGNIEVRFPEGGGGSHMLYDLFYAYADSSNNWWEGITQTMGAMAPEFTADGSKVLFIYDLSANKVDSSYPKYRLALWDTKTFATETLEFEAASEMVAFTPTMSPDMTQVAFVVMRLRGEQLTPAGVAIAKVSEFPLSDETIDMRAKKLATATAPCWSPDGKWIAYVSNDMASPGLHVVSPDLSESKVVYTPKAPTAISPVSPSWSPDASMLLFSTQDGAIYKIALDGGEAVRLSGPGNDYSPAWSN
jgi:Tol biopolymer transport system component